MTDTSAAGIARIHMTGDDGNPLDLALVRELADTLDRLDKDPAVRAAVLISTGKHFCAGATAKFTEGQAAWSTADLYAEVPRIAAFGKPLVAALNGAAVGGGAGLALLADWRQMAADARLQINFSRLGYTPGFGLTRTLPDLIGAHRATELLISGRRVTAAEAQSLGLCDAVSEPGSLVADSLARAAEFAQGAPLAVRAIKQHSRRGLLADLPAILRDELAQQTQLKKTADYAEGMSAARERRSAAFIGR
ncbi:enoyl-CoA hydratase/isomerase family protein [Nocardia jinanensis]|uniref:enoyl-CoA hydratase/isomerase family protein n=1 Tax=Nocardia jinanensis TaxID=382504 RepID=UPI0007A462DF|nr:enoyl-CoA hydratase/isomerase family protein [Nocardia jinanensis]